MRRSPVTVAKAYRLLHAILTTAEDDRLIRRNPCRIDNAGKEDSPEREIVPLPVVFAIAKAVPVRYRALAALGRVLGLDRSPEVKTIRRKLGELAAAGKAADLIMALARRHAAARPDAPGFLYADGHARACYGTRNVQKMHIVRLKSPAPATAETWVTSQDGEPVFMVAAEPSESLTGELRRLLPQLRGIVGQERRVTVCFDRGGWSPALFADITAAGFDLLTWRKGPAPDVPADEFTTITCADDRGREHQYDLPAPRSR